jgi:hypothetical protein
MRELAAPAFYEAVELKSPEVVNTTLRKTRHYSQM